jgi:hypothetical protein
LTRDGDEHFEIIEAAGVNIARLQQDNRRLAVNLAQCCFERAWVECSNSIDAQLGHRLIADAGLTPYRPAFWSQVEVSQSAARAEGKDPPITHA